MFRPSVYGKHDCVRTQKATDLKICTLAIPTLVGIENGLYRSTGSGTSHIGQIGTSHISQIGTLGSWAHRTSDSHQI